MMELQDDIRAALEELRETEAQRVAMVAAIHAHPGLFWIKEFLPGSGGFRMVSVSYDYARLYLGNPPEFYEGQTDATIWPPEVAEAFAENDRRALQLHRVDKGGKPLEIHEPIESVLTGVCGMFKGVKYAFRAGDRYYVAGLGEHVPA